MQTFSADVLRKSADTLRSRSSDFRMSGYATLMGPWRAGHWKGISAVLGHLGLTTFLTMVWVGLGPSWLGLGWVGLEKR